MIKVVVTYIDSETDSIDMIVEETGSLSIYKTKATETSAFFYNAQAPLNKYSIFTIKPIEKLEFYDNNNFLFKTMTKEQISKFSYAIEKDSDSNMCETLTITSID